MSNYEFIRKNLTLSAEFNAYLLTHPELLAELPDNSCVVFEAKNDRLFSERNLKIARETHRKCYIATKEGKLWDLRKFTT